jgi:LacI family transcriptional regulator, gluconate utilization system Gnt-I transcriptional repressor
MFIQMSTATPEERHSVPTLSAVAKLAGVSSITVSRVVRLPALVAPETRGRVEAAMRELGYVPNQLAVALARARTRSIGVLVPTIRQFDLRRYGAGPVRRIGAARLRRDPGTVALRRRT